jgi:CheY-like chemotaxis protein/GAF domain-containing protein
MAANSKRAVLFAAADFAASAAHTDSSILLLGGTPIDPVAGREIALPDTTVDCLVVDSSSPERLADASMGALGLFQLLPDGVAFLDDQLVIRWHNTMFQQVLGSQQTLAGRPLQEALAPADGTDFNRVGLPQPNSNPVELTIRREDKSILALRLVSTPAASTPAPSFLLTVRDITGQTYEKQKQEAIYRAGLELHDLSPDEVTQMTPEERVALLKEHIHQATQEVLGYDRFEIRLLNSDTQELIPLLEYGMCPEAASRRLFAAESGNGVTGFVAWSKRSYLCADTQNDNLYLSGAADARSSLTVPLMIRDTVLGTFNVESPGTLAFNERDLDFLRLFGRVIAGSLNQLQLLEAEKASAASENTDRLRREVAQPSDDILNAVTWILERYIGHDPDVCERLYLIADRIRQIRTDIGTIAVEPHQAALSTPIPQRPPRPALVNKRILVVDPDPLARDDAHNLLGQMQCIVEAVQTAGEACRALRNFHYDVVLTDIRLSDANGYECFRRLRDINMLVPIIMMTGFGWDSTHSIVKARQEGLKAVLYKPFRRAQLLDEVEKAVTTPPPSPG